MEKERSSRNKTLILKQEEGPRFMGKILRPKKGEILTVNQILGKTLCADLFDVLDLLPSSFADLIIVDPPYNLSKNFNGLNFGAMKEVDYIDYVRSWFAGLCRLLKPNGSIYVCCDWKSTSAIQQVMRENVKILNRITWQREKGRGAVSNWKNGMEDIWFGVKNDKDYYFDVDAVKVRRKVIAPYKIEGQPKDWEVTDSGNFRMTYPSNFWDDITVPYWSMAENTNHPTQKPEKLIAKLILASCPENGVVFDPFLGSGTTSVVAKKLARRYCGVEINEEYCLWCEKRLEQADSVQSIQGYTQGVFWERNSLGQQKSKGNKSQVTIQNPLF
ncbi:MAG: DNA methyltransferase [Mucinivorans sp.]